MTGAMFNSEEKSAAQTPTYVVTSPASEKRNGIQKKHVLIAVSVVVIVGLVIAGIMIGMYMFSETQKEIIKFSLQFKASNNEQATQEVISDPNDQVVMYHVSKPGQDVHVVNDFNKDLQVVKIETEDSTNCYISPLNRSQAMDPSQITDSASLTKSGGSDSQSFILSSTPVSDTSFLTKKARDMCKGVSVYWAYRHCAQEIPSNQNMTKSDSPARTKRSYVVSPYCGMYGLGCGCQVVWACEIWVYETATYCDFYYRTGTCCSTSPCCNSVYFGRSC